MGNKKGTIPVFPPDEVTTVGSLETPGASGLPAGAEERIWRSVVELYRTRLQPAIALAIYHRGQLILDRAIGHATGVSPDGIDPERLRPATTDSLYNLFSASKAVTAMLVHHLDEEGYFRLDDPVQEYIPEFRGHGRERITLRQILMHTAGVPRMRRADVDLDILGDPEEILRRILALKPSFAAGRRLAYHAITGGYILGEIVRRTTGKDLRTHLRETVELPLGLVPFNYGVPPERTGEVAWNVSTGTRPKVVFPPLLERGLGVRLEEAVELSNDPRFLTAVIPAANLITIPRHAARFYELLRNHGELDGKRIFARRTVRRALQRQTVWEFDVTLGMPVTYGLGFMLGRRWVGFYGPRSENAFGHLGLINILTWADPDRELAAALITTGKPFVHLHMVRWLQVVWKIAATIPRKNN